MKNPAAALNLHLRSCSSTELLPLLLFCLFLSLSFPVHLVHSKSDTSNGEEPVQWQILTKNNFSSQVRLNPHILLIVTVPWSGESRSLMKELAHMVSKKKEEFKTLKLMLVYKNHDKMLAEALGATMETNIISYRHSLPYKYQGTFRVQSILSSAHYLMSLLPEELPFKSLQNAHDLTTFLESTDKAFLVLEFCGWTPKLMAKVMNNRSENAFGVPLVAGLHGQSSEPDGIKNKGIGNEKIACDEFSGLPGLGEFAPLNESDFMEAEKTRSTIDEASCSYEEFQLFESSLYNLTTSVRDFFLPPERLKFGLVSERSLISSLGVGDTSSWLMMVYSSGCPECAKVFKEGGDFKRIIEINSSPAMELKGDEYDLDPGLPSDRPSMVLFIDRSSDSLKIRRKSKEALNTFRQLALHNHTPSKTNPQKHLIASQHPKLEMTTSLQKVTALKDKIFLMAMKEGKHITIDDIASSLQGSSLQEVLTQLLQKKKEKKLSSLAKDVGFQLLSDDIDITVPDTDGTDVSSSVPSDDVDLTVPGVNCSFFFIDGQFRLLKHLSTVQKIPSLVIINPLSHQHYVYPQDSNFNFTYSDISNFLHMFLNGSLVPYQRSGSIVTNPKESPRPPFVNQDFHEVDSIPRVNALSFMELVVGNNNHSGLNNISWKKDVLVLFTSSWCGFCLRTELVVREVYQAFKNYGNLVKSQLKKVNLKLPVIYMIDCTENDCTSLLKSSTKRDLYPSLVLYPSESKEAISYDGETSVHNIIKFIADQGGDSHWIYKEQGILWTEPQQEQWNEKPLKEPILDSDVSFSHEILLKDRSDSGPHNSEPDNNNNIVSQTSVNEIKIQPGSILIATQKLQSIYPFAKSKILIVKVNTTTGFQGLIVNKHISWDTITRLEGQHGVSVFLMPSGMLGTLLSLVDVLPLFANTKWGQDANLKFLKTHMGATFETRSKPWRATINPDDVHSGDFLAVSKIRGRWGGFETLEKWVTGAFAGHTAVCMKDDFGNLWVGESGHENEKGEEIIVVIPWDEWWELALKDESNPQIALLPLHPEIRAKWNNSAAWEYALSMSGKPYGYHNMIFSWIDTIGDNYPPPIDAHLVISVMSMWTRMQPAYAANMWNEALNMRLGTEGLDLYGILEETEKRGITFDELMTIPENDEWVYSDGKSTTCVAFILQIYKAAGVFGPFADSIQVTEFTIRDAYMLKIFENNQTRFPQWCNNGDDKLPFCQILGKYRMELPLYNTLQPYANMNENCPSLPPTYQRPLHC